MVLKNRELRRTLGPKRVEEMGPNGDIHNLYYYFTLTEFMNLIDSW
jgi:hypothetical protein